jgi:hypothetical protein
MYQVLDRAAQGKLGGGGLFIDTSLPSAEPDQLRDFRLDMQQSWGNCSIDQSNGRKLEKCSRTVIPNSPYIQFF